MTIFTFRNNTYDINHDTDFNNSSNNNQYNQYNNNKSNSMLFRQ